MNWVTLSILILGGLSIFLFGMNIMIEALKSAAGNRIKTFLKNMTRNRWTALLAGTGITAVIQSSSVTTVLAVGFVSAGLLSFQSTLGFILGANLGTTITAQIIAFKVTNAAYLLVICGYLGSVLFSNKTIRDICSIILGLGLVFLGMNIMSDATSPLKEYEPFIELMKGLDNHFPGILIGVVFTAIIQSSSATAGVVIVMASQGLISSDAGIALIFGSNIGTCVTAMLSALGKPLDAMRLAFSHILFNVMGVIIWYFFIGDLSGLVQSISPNDTARQIANAHTIFNVGNTLIFIWFVNPVSRLIIAILPDPKDIKEVFPELHSYYLESSSMAMDLARNSLYTLGNHLVAIAESGLSIAFTGSDKDLDRLRKKDDLIDKGQEEILQFLRKIQALELTENETRRLESLIEATNIMESTADVITNDLVEAAEHRIENNIHPGMITIEKLTELYKISVESLKESLENFDNIEGHTEITVSKEEFKERLIPVRSHLVQRLSVKDEVRISVFRFETEILEIIRRLHALARRLNRKIC